ncbi:hypothetical protein BOX15_Mlig014553g1 [Macrostomum lignano]|uniref:MFS domain-containing protein n=1 Tax=Macrostomum lignano TaxID=282301 RepID=A0A267F3U2_9PLAT|nr:hypothetical protein BOX15_Mlig014553g1 [Macrostomum lignano]
MPPYPHRHHSSPKMRSHGQPFSNESAMELNEENGAQPSAIPSVATLTHSNTMDPLITSNQSVYPNLEVNVMEVPALSTCRRLLYGLAAPPSAMCGNILGFLMSVYLLEVAKLSPGLVLTISFAGRFWDAVSDPLIGYLVTRTKTRWGKCRIWVLGSAPLCATSFILLFHTPSWQWTPGRFIYYFVVYFAFCTFLTTYHIPYTAMTMLISSRTVDRDAATTFRMVFEMVGTLFGVMTFTFITQIGPDRCTLASASGNSHSNGSLLPSNQSAPATAHVSPEEEARYRLGASIIGAVVLLCGGIGFFGTKEIAAEVKQAKPTLGNAVADSNSDSMLATFRSCLCHRPYRLLMLSFMLSSLAIQTVQNSLALYTIYSLKMKPHLKFAIAVVMVTAILVTPLVFYLIRRLGKKRVFIIGLALILPVCLSATFCPARVQFVPQYYATMVVAGCYVSINMLLPWIMLPDVIDDYTVSTGRRDEAAFYSLYVFFNKFAVGISTACLQLGLHLTGYQLPPSCHQPEMVGYALRVMMGPLPMLLVVAAFIVLRLYPITPEYRRNLDKRMLKAAQLDGLPMNLNSLDYLGSSVDPLAASGNVASLQSAAAEAADGDSNGGGGPSGSGIVGCCLHPGGGDSGCGGSDSASDPDGVCRKKRLSSSSSSSQSGGAAAVC